ncbi:Frataxin [Parathielavia hyrcaniae]|uniref:ferroxidase n=1 Tax=Parathielavia hyrcaniae TaxID=113614 RepID=A0AAN6Q2P1_9PEZI|nr:Frataxin [Parathielavia hyrcaniae]
MARPIASKLARIACNGIHTNRVARTILPALSAAPLLLQAAPWLPAAHQGRRLVSKSASLSGITPDDKAPKQPETPPITRTPADITDDEYHAVADEYMEKLLNHLEALQDTREEVDVEYSSGVLTLSLGPHIGTYVINKQPPNKQIWLSSPQTGPKRYDYVVFGEGQHEKQDTATGDWVYLRDGSTLNDLLMDELGIDLRVSDTELGS